MSVARRVVLLIALPLLILQIVLLILGNGIQFFWFIFIGLAAVNYILWRRDEGYQAGLEAEPDDVPIPAVEKLAESIRLAAQLAALSIRVDRDIADGFGLKNVAILDVSTGESGQVVRLWDEGFGDFWIEFAGATAAWWRQGRKEATLAEVVVALLEGRFTAEGEVLTVSPRDRTSLVLSSRM